MACYAEGALLMGEAAGQDGRGKLIMTARDLSKPPVGTAIGSWPAGSGLRETVAELGLAIPGGGHRRPRRRAAACRTQMIGC